MLRRMQISLCRSLLLKNICHVESPLAMMPLPDKLLSISPSRRVWNGAPHFAGHPLGRPLSNSSRSSEVDQDRVVELINIKFAEAREEIEMAMESKETVYFDEEAECARDAVKQVLDLFQGLMAQLPESDKASLQRSMGLKIEQLKAELKQLDD